MNEIDSKHLAEAQAVLRENCVLDFPRPWIGEAASGIVEHGPWADYHGWHQWMDRFIADFPDERAQVWWDDLGPLDDTALYVAMSNACMETAEAMGWKGAAPTAESVNKETK